jgi:N-acetylglucosamine-6-phosphate deacetylase
MQRQGFIDLQVNGWKGIDFSNPSLTLDDVRTAVRALVSEGTAAFCPTVVTGPETMFRHNLAVLGEAIEDRELARHLLGIHLEGPFISPALGARGAHPEQYIVPPSFEMYERLQEYANGHIVMLTVAPDQPGAIELIQKVSCEHVVVSLGHHLAGTKQLERAVSAGAKCCTHLGNGLPMQIHRHQNPLWWQLAAKRLWGMFITDGHHLPAEFITVALAMKTPFRFIVTSDAAPIAGLPAGPYTCFGSEVVIEPSGRIICESSQSLAGSSATMLTCMNYLASLGQLSEEELWQIGFDNPLHLIGRSPRTVGTKSDPQVRYDAERKQFVVESLVGVN